MLKSNFLRPALDRLKMYEDHDQSRLEKQVIWSGKVYLLHIKPVNVTLHYMKMESENGSFSSLEFKSYKMENLERQ